MHENTDIIATVSTRLFLGICRRFPPFLACRIQNWCGRRCVAGHGFVRCRPLFGGTAIVADLGDAVDRQFALFGTANLMGMALASCVVSEGDTVFEFGANVGTETLSLSSLVGNSGCVVAVEANPVNARKLSDRVSQSGNDNITVVERAVCACVEDVSLISGPKNNSGMSSISISDERGASTESAKVPTVAADDLLADFPAPRLLCMDIEGSELSALESAHRILKEVRPFVTLEVDATFLARMNATTEQVLDLLSHHGYRVYDMQKRTLPRVSLSDSRAEVHTDWLGIPGEQCDQFYGRIRNQLLAARVLPRFWRLSPIRFC